MPVPAILPMTIAGMGALTADTIRKGKAAEAIRRERAGGKGLMDRLSDKVDATRGYIIGYDTQQTPFEVAKERGAAGVLGGFADKMTGNRFDFDERGESKKQKDTKEFLNKFIYGTGEQMRQANPAGAMPGYEFPDSKSYVPGKTQFGGFS